MIKFLFLFLLITILNCSCSEKKAIINRTKAFESFEISYKDGWTRSFSLFTDSSKVYFSPQKWDSTFYGILPDSIFEVLNTTALKIVSNKLKPQKTNCFDCPVIAVKINRS